MLLEGVLPSWTACSYQGLDSSISGATTRIGGAAAKSDVAFGRPMRKYAGIARLRAWFKHVLLTLNGNFWKYLCLPEISGNKYS